MKHTYEMTELEFRNRARIVLVPLALLLGLIIVLAVRPSSYEEGLVRAATLYSDSLKADADLKLANKAVIEADASLASLKATADIVASTYKSSATSSAPKPLSDLTSTTFALEMANSNAVEAEKKLEAAKATVTSKNNKTTTPSTAVQGPVNRTPPNKSAPWYVIVLPLSVGALAVVLVWTMLWQASGVNGDNRNWFRAAITGEDGQASTSKLQAIVWMLAVVFAYFSLLVLRTRFDQWAGIPQLPTNLQIALGLSSTTAVVSKFIAIRSSRTHSSKRLGQWTANGVPALQGPAPSKTKQSWTLVGLIRDDYGKFDVGKVFVLFWTGTAILVFLATLAAQLYKLYTPSTQPIDSTLFGVPDVDKSLVALMGLGQALYLGSKIGLGDSIKLLGITPTMARPGKKVTLTTSLLPAGIGSSLRDVAGSPSFVQVLVDSVTVQVDDFDLVANQFSFTVPAVADLLATPKKVDVAILFEGVSTTTLPLTLSSSPWPNADPSAIHLLGASPILAKPGDLLTLSFTTIPEEVFARIHAKPFPYVQISVAQTMAEIKTLNDSELTFVVPTTLPPGSGQQGKIQMTVLGIDATGDISIQVVPATIGQSGT